MFDELFNETKGQPIDYKGKKIIRIDYFVLKDIKSKLRLTLESFNSSLKQGLIISALHKKKIKVHVNNEIIENAVVFWQDTAPAISEMEIFSKEKTVCVYNVWDYGRGVRDFWHNGGAMYTEEIPNGKRYYCNDGYPDDDFDDMIFTLEEVEK